MLQAEVVFIQTDQALKEDMLGQKRTANGLGWSPTGNWKTKCVQYLTKGRKRDKVTGEFIDGYRVVVYPNLRPTAEPTKKRIGNRFSRRRRPYSMDIGSTGN